MSTTELQKPVLDGGIFSINFFNGRLLSGEDLSAEQEANREANRRLGRAVGDGIVYGLEVSRTPGVDSKESPSLRIEPGLAVNRRGHALQLENRIDLSLLRPEKITPGEVRSLSFVDCEPFQAGVYVAGAGVYLLTVAPAEARQGLAPVTGLGNVEAPCNSKYIVRGVQFRLIQIDLTPEELSEEKRLRNLVAYKCFGIKGIGERYRNPIDQVLEEFGLLGELRLKDRLTNCDVPLAILHWTAEEGIRFVDMWSVRRSIEARARFLCRNRNSIYSIVRQFQDHLNSFGNLGEIEVSDYFYHLPPFGQLPIREPQYQSYSGIELKKFFGSKYNRLPSIINSWEIMALFRSAIAFLPRHAVDIESVEVFFIAENIKALSEGTEQQLLGFFTFGEIDARYCASVKVISNGTVLDSNSYAALFKACYQAYQDFRKIILLHALPTGAQLTKQDTLGIEAIDQVLSTSASLLSSLTVGCMNNHELWVSLQRLADQEKYFADTWLDIVLPQEDGKRYLEEIKDLIEELKGLLLDEMVQGFRGLLRALADHDLFSAYLAQQKINQSFTREIGAGPRGVISINYSIAPVAPENGENGGDGGGSEDKIGPGKYLFGFTLNGRVDREASFHLKPRIAAFGWDVELWDVANQQPRDSEFIILPKSDHLPDEESRDVFVRVTVPETGDSLAELIFDVEEVSGAGGIPKASDSVTIEVGKQIPRPDDRVLVILDSYGNATPREGGIAIGREVLSAVQFVIRVRVPGQFSAHIEPLDGRTWTKLELTTDQFEAPPGTSSEVPYNEVTAAVMKPGEAASDTELIFTVNSASDDVDPPIKERFRLSVIIE